MNSYIIACRKKALAHNGAICPTKVAKRRTRNMSMIYDCIVLYIYVYTYFICETRFTEFFQFH